MECPVFTFEVLAIDKNGETKITKEQSLINALLYAENLWKNAKTAEVNHSLKIVDEEQSLKVKIHLIDTESTLTDLIESAFVIKITGTDFEQIERFRLPFVFHLKKKLGFTNIRILKDDISTKISNDIYRLINQVENELRCFLIMFFTQKIGVEWWDVTTNKLLSDKIGLRKFSEKVFSPLVDTDITLIDFDDLGELVYKHSSGFNRRENIVAKVMSTVNIEDLKNLKEELQGNYTKYFKDTFQDNNFERKWKTLYDIRNKVAHNNLFILDDFKTTEKLVEDILKIIETAESTIDSFRFSVEEQEAIRQATIEVVQTETKEKALEKYGLKVLGKIDLPDQDDIEDDDYDLMFITEEELLEELENSEKLAVKKGFKFIGLKLFVTKVLANKGYAPSPTYSLVNILRDRGVIEIYDAEDENNYFTSKAIRLPKGDKKKT